MDKLKKWGKYVLAVIAVYIFTAILSFVGLNLNYKDIETKSSLPEQITIEKAEATSSNGRIYGYVYNNQTNDINGYYIKTEIYDSNYEVIDVQYLKIEGVESGEKKMFKVFFGVDDAKFYNIDIVNSE